ncbi:unnamed protein product, partial [Prorocentrum cordatum]
MMAGDRTRQVRIQMCLPGDLLTVAAPPRGHQGEVHPRGAVLEGAGAVDRGEDAHDAGGGRLLPQRAERGAVAGRGAGGGGLAVAGAADPLGGVSRPPPPPWRRPRGPPSRLTPPP